MEIRRDFDGDILILSVSGDFDTTEVENFHAEILAAVDADFFRVLLDLEGLRFVNSTALGALLTSQKRMAQYGGGVAAANLQPAVDKTMKILGLDQKIAIHSDMESAKAYLKNLSTDSVSATGEEVEFLRPDAEAEFGTRARRGRLEKIHNDGLSMEFENLDGLDPETVFPVGARVDLRFLLPLYHPDHIFNAGSAVTGTELLGRETVRVHVEFTELSDPEREAVKQYVKDLRLLKGEG